ncbi:hypothetical protein IFR05_009103 [Cadophora sp. M221]|nr:hypothetical protein IFR05_009103 [Cadophora sp. M221]
MEQRINSAITKTCGTKFTSSCTTSGTSVKSKSRMTDSIRSQMPLTLSTHPGGGGGKKTTARKTSGSGEMEDDSQKENLKDGKTLEMLIEEVLTERLERRIKKREESGDFRVCAAHDIAPILEKALEINPKQLSRDKIFLDLMA